MQSAVDQSIFSTFLNAGIIIQVVMISLVLASFWSWTIIFAKVSKIKELNKLANKFEDLFWSGKSLADIQQTVGARALDPFTSVFLNAMREWNHVAGKQAGKMGREQTLEQRIERIMSVTVSREMENVERHVGFLATVGSTATFVGLFGTVWGIMNSFQAIGMEKNTSLAVVAPGIAEALFATALGLIAAIPAMVAYNKISSDFNRYGNRLDSFAQELSAILSRQLDQYEEAA